MRINRRTKIISIRVTTDEFNRLQDLCATRGVNTISQLARVAMEGLIGQENGKSNGSVESRVDEIRERMSALDREIARLSSHVGLPRLEETL